MKHLGSVGISSPKNNVSNILTHKQSRSPDHRQKLPVFKPKTLNEIYSENRCKKSSDSIEKHLSPNKYKVIKEEQAHKNQPSIVNKSSPLNNKIQQQKIQMTQSVPNPKLKNSLEDFIKESGHGFQVQSQQIQNSQYDDEFFFNDEQTNQFNETPKKNRHGEYKALTPQSAIFSKGYPKQQNPFEYKDDMYFTNKMSQGQKPKFWDGKITLSSSICYQQFQNGQLKQQPEIPSDIKPYIFPQRYYYIQCMNLQTQNTFIFEFQMPIKKQQLEKNLKEIQNRLSKSKKQLNIEFFDQKTSKQQLESLKYSNSVIFDKKFLRLNYQVNEIKH